MMLLHVSFVKKYIYLIKISKSRAIFSQAVRIGARQPHGQLERTWNLKLATLFIYVVYLWVSANLKTWTKIYINK